MISGYPDNWNQQEVFRQELLDGETIEWCGQPDPSVVFSKADIFMVPFSLLWGGFAIFWEFGVLGMTSRHGRSSGPDLIFPLFGIPFVLIGLYFIFGRFIYKAWKKRRTYYALTDKRVLILTLGLGRSVQAAFIRDVPTVNKSRGLGGTGNVIFGNSSGIASMYANTGMGGMAGAYGPQAPAFYDIKDADAVYSLFNRLRSQAS